MGLWVGLAGRIGWWGSWRGPSRLRAGGRGEGGLRPGPCWPLRARTHTHTHTHNSTMRGKSICLWSPVCVCARARFRMSVHVCVSVQSQLSPGASYPSCCVCLNFCCMKGSFLNAMISFSRLRGHTHPHTQHKPLRTTHAQRATVRMALTHTHARTHRHTDTHTHAHTDTHTHTQDPRLTSRSVAYGTSTRPAAQRSTRGTPAQVQSNTATS